MMDLFGLELVDGGVNRIIVKTVGDALRHNIRCFGCLKIGAVSDGTADDIAVGQHADQTVILTYGEAADFVIAHLLRGLGDS